jgi:hypothetical protein
VQQAVTQLLGLSDREVAAEEQDLRPGEQVDAAQSEFEPGGVDREHAGGEATEPGVFPAADAVFHTAGVSVAITWWRMPSMVSNRDSCAPGCGFSRRTMNRMPAG